MSWALLATLLALRSAAMVIAILLDALLGEPRRLHPLVGFGELAARIERIFWSDRRAAGVAAWSVAVLPWVMLASATALLAWTQSPWVWLMLASVLLYLTLGLHSLGAHALAVADALDADDLPQARQAVARMVSRDTAALDAEGIAGAATESALENGCDAVFGALFWFLLFGIPGALLYRLSNTLDAMWGYRTPRFQRFGWAAARIDDALNWLPARLTVLAYAASGDFRCGLRCARLQGGAWKSPNAGPVMAAGAGALRVRLGGAASYHGSWTQRPVLGKGSPADASTIRRAIRLVRRATAYWLLLPLAIGGVMSMLAGAQPDA